jgi:hypothetical protein
LIYIKDQEENILQCDEKRFRADGLRYIGLTPPLVRGALRLNASDCHERASPDTKILRSASNEDQLRQLQHAPALPADGTG